MQNFINKKIVLVILTRTDGTISQRLYEHVGGGRALSKRKLFLTGKVLQL